MTQPYASDGRALPLITPTTRPFFDAAREQRLLLQHCPRDGYFFYPRSRCPHCLGVDWQWREADSLGHVHSYTIAHMAFAPGMEALLPLGIAVVDMAVGVRMVGGLIDCDQGALRAGLAVRACFQVVDDTPLLCFRPCPGAAAARDPR